MIQISMLKTEFSNYLQCWVCVKHISGGSLVYFFISTKVECADGP